MNKNNLGLAYAAKKVVLGTDKVIHALRQGKLSLVILATDASLNTKKKINDKANTYKTEVLERLNSEELSNAIGAFNVKVLGITDQGFKDLLVK